jgi:hypothetical protein
MKDGERERDRPVHGGFDVYIYIYNEDYKIDEKKKKRKKKEEEKRKEICRHSYC